MEPAIEVASNLEEASLLLDGYAPLDPGNDPEQFRQYYVERPIAALDLQLIRESKTAHRNHRQFHWFFSGHTGAGKSTELNRLMDNPAITGNYLPLYIDITEGVPERRIVEIDYTEVILEMAVACTRKAEELNIALPAELSEHIAHWGQEAELIRQEFLGTEGRAGLQVKAWFGWLREELKSGGETRKSIKEKLYKDINRFIELLNGLAGAIESASGKSALVVIDGLDHVDVKPCQDLFTNYYLTLSRPKLSKLFIVPLHLMNTDFRTSIREIGSTLPNILVFSHPGGSALNGEGTGIAPDLVARLDPAGYAFFKELISRYARLELFADEALASLFTLSGGIVRDMIRFSGEACGIAQAEGVAQVTAAQVEPLWHETMRFFQDILYKSDYITLRAIRDNPNPEGIDNIPNLIFRKAIVYYPNGRGWYGVHPAVDRLLAELGPSRSPA